MAQKLRAEARENLRKLPSSCWGVLLETKDIIKIIKGEKGYHKINGHSAKEGLEIFGCSSFDELADKLNETEGITKPQRKAMEWGSQFGWHTRAANPDFYDKNGKPLKEKV
jgi:hypothetical protein